MSTSHDVISHHDGMLQFPKSPGKEKPQTTTNTRSSVFFPSCILFDFFATGPSPGGNGRMAQFFRGNLAGLMIRSGKLENKKVIDCLYTCKEGLDVQLPEDVASSIKVCWGQAGLDRVTLAAYGGILNDANLL